eukprot:2371321-Prymnesium_polylepis.1
MPSRACVDDWSLWMTGDARGAVRGPERRKRISKRGCIVLYRFHESTDIVWCSHCCLLILLHERARGSRGDHHVRG